MASGVFTKLDHRLSVDYTGTIPGFCDPDDPNQWAIESWLLTTSGDSIVTHATGEVAPAPWAHLAASVSFEDPYDKMPGGQRGGGEG